MAEEDEDGLPIVRNEDGEVEYAPQPAPYDSAELAEVRSLPRAISETLPVSLARRAPPLLRTGAAVRGDASDRRHATCTCP